MTIKASKYKFLEEVAEFAIKNSGNNFSKLKILLPTGLACTELQKILVSKLGPCILPKIIPIIELVAESEEIFKIPSEQIGRISRLEEKIILAGTIYDYKILDYDLLQSLRLSPSLAKLFFELEANNIKLEDIKKLPILDQPEHWHKIFDFLSFAFDNWQAKIHAMKKITRASYQKLMIAAEIQRLRKDSSESIIIAGVVGNNMMIADFLKTAGSLNNCHFIAPPESDLTSQNNIQANIRYVEFENIAHEAEYIATQCVSELKLNPQSRIALIAHNQQSKEQYQIFLDKYSLGYKDQFGENILSKHSISLLLLVAELLCYEFDLKRFFTFLAHPMINSPKSQELKHLIRKNNRFAASLDAISSIVEKHEDNELSKYFASLAGVLSYNISSNQFTTIFKDVIKAAQKFVPTIWQNDQGAGALITEIIQLKALLEISNIEDFPDILQQVIDGGRLFPASHEEQITICAPNASALINYDLIIITDLNEGNYPKTSQNSPWLSQKMQIMIGLDTRQTDFDNALYDFYLNIQNKNVLLTRAKKQSSNKSNLPSPFILNLKHILGNELKMVYAKPAFEELKSNLPEISSKSQSFPDILYATDIETLIRAPYNFYAKKILKLRKIDEIDERPNLAEFGNFFHSSIEHYTKNYTPNNADKVLQFTSIAESILKNSHIPNHSKKLWQIKINAMADEFIKFDEDRRKNAIAIYSELQGHTRLSVKEKSIMIKAIADRIELGKDGGLAILDFKTGALPTKKDVLSGLSPQLVVEAIIALDGGFPIDSKMPFKNELTIVYVKIGSSSPYISLSEITLSTDEILLHKAGLSSLVEHYIDGLEFPMKPNLMKYDDYSHLARRNQN